MASEAFMALYYDHVAASYDKQLTFNELLEGLGRDYNLDAEKGLITFGNAQSFAVQILGTESEISKTWLWLWGNETEGVAPESQTAAAALRAYGLSHGVPELAIAEFRTSPEAGGHAVAMIACGIIQADAYIVRPFDDGAAYILITDSRLKRTFGKPAQRIATVFPRLIAGLEITDHHAALSGYMQFYGLSVAVNGTTLTGHAPDGDTLIASFDSANRLQSLSVV